MFNNDIVGNSHGGNGIVDAESVRVYCGGPRRLDVALARALHRAARRDLRAVTSHPADGAATIASAAAATTRRSRSRASRHRVPRGQRELRKQHSARDTIDGVDFAYLAQNARVNAAGVASLALAPAGAPGRQRARPEPADRAAPPGYDANCAGPLRPAPSPIAIYWRDTWSNDWQHRQSIGNVTEFVLPNVSIDDFVFGVAAIGADGQESLVSAYVSPVRQSTDVKVVK